MHIASAANVAIPAYLALHAKGYRVWRDMSASSADSEWWQAEGPLGSFAAENPLALLGLVALAEVRGEQWCASDVEIDQFLRMFCHNA